MSGIKTQPSIHISKSSFLIGTYVFLKIPPGATRPVSTQKVTNNRLLPLIYIILADEVQDLLKYECSQLLISTMVTGSCLHTG